MSRRYRFDHGVSSIGMSDEWTVRTATSADEAAVSALLEASYVTLMASAYDEAQLAPALRLMTKANPALLASGTFYLAEDSDGSIVGCGGWTSGRPGTNETQPGLAHVRHFATHPGWTNRGIGRTIYDQCERSARVAGAEAFECYSSLNAERFYAAMGFERVRLCEICLQDDISLPAVLMRRHICASGNAA